MAKQVRQRVRAGARRQLDRLPAVRAVAVATRCVRQSVAVGPMRSAELSGTWPEVMQYAQQTLCRNESPPTKFFPPRTDPLGGGMLSTSGRFKVFADAKALERSDWPALERPGCWSVGRSCHERQKSSANRRLLCSDKLYPRDERIQVREHGTGSSPFDGEDGSVMVA